MLIGGIFIHIMVNSKYPLTISAIISIGGGFMSYYLLNSVNCKSNK